MRKILAFLLTCCMLISLVACGNGAPVAPTVAQTAEATKTPTDDTTVKADLNMPEVNVEPAELSAVQEIIQQAQTMSVEELAAKAITESNGGVFTAISDDEVTRAALDKFIMYLTSLNSHYTVTVECDIAKEDIVLGKAAADSVMEKGKWSVVLVSDGVQTYKMMKDRQVLHTFVPSKWMKDNGFFENDFTGYLPVVTKVDALTYNCTGKDTFNTCWDFVTEGRKPYNISASYADDFLIMLTREDNAAYIRESFDHLGFDQKAEFQPMVDELVPQAQAMGLSEDGAYALAWIKLWVTRSQANLGNDAILAAVSSNMGENECGVVDYSTVAVMSQTTNNSTNNVKVAAYEPVYNGIGGFAHSEYAFVTNNAAMPWMACAFIAYITTTQDGFSAWGRNPGFYTSDLKLAEEILNVFGHNKNGYYGDGINVLYPAKNDKGIDWWNTSGKAVEEDFEYIDSMSFTVGNWLKTLN